MYATVTNTMNKGSSLPMALRAAATERVVSFTSTALRRGETRSGAGPVVEILKSEFVSKCGARYIESFDAEDLSPDPKVGQSQNRERHHSGVNSLASLFNLRWCLKALRPRWHALPRAKYLTVLANPSLNRTLHSVPSISPPFHSGPIAVPLFRAG